MATSPATKKVRNGCSFPPIIRRVFGSRAPLVLLRPKLASDEQLRNAAHRAAGEDPHNWDIVAEDISKSFSETISLIREDAERLGIDIDAEVDAIEDQTAEQWQRTQKHPLYEAAFEFTKRAGDFLKTYGESLGEEIDRQALGERTAVVEDAIETLSWYHVQVPAKVFRAVHDVCDDRDEIELDQVDRDDANGSAKVAHLGLIRSMKALLILQDCRPWLREETTKLSLLFGDLVGLADPYIEGYD